MAVTMKAILPKLRVPDSAALLLAAGAGLYVTAQKMATQGKELCPVDTGVLRASIGVSDPKSHSRNLVEVTLYAGGPAAPYALYVHEGTKPHVPPLFPLMEWAARHGLGSKWGLGL